MKLTGRKDWDTAESGEGVFEAERTFEHWALKSFHWKHWKIGATAKVMTGGLWSRKRWGAKTEEGAVSHWKVSAANIVLLDTDVIKRKRQPQRQSQIQKQLKVQCSHNKSSQPSEIGTTNAGPWCLSNPSVTMTAQTLEYEDISLRRHCFGVFFLRRKNI